MVRLPLQQLEQPVADSTLQEQWPVGEDPVRKLVAQDAGTWLRWLQLMLLLPAASAKRLHVAGLVPLVSIAGTAENAEHPADVSVAAAVVVVVVTVAAAALLVPEQAAAVVFQYFAVVRQQAAHQHRQAA